MLSVKKVLETKKAVEGANALFFWVSDFCEG